jgi:hypothetical protein
MIPTTPHQRNSNKDLNPVDRVQNSPDTPCIFVQTVDSDASSFTVVDGSVDHQTTETSFEAREGRNGLGVGSLMNSHRVDKENGARKFSNARRPGQQQHGPSGQPPDGTDQDLPALPTDSSGRDPKPPFRSGSVRKNEGKYLEYECALRLF